MSLEVQTNKTPGDVLRATESPRPAMVGLIILVLTALEFVLAFLVFDAVFRVGANSPTITSPALEGAPLIGLFVSDQRIISMWLGALFMNLGVITLLYQRYFMDHITIAKRRFRKWEDEGVQLK